MAIGDIKYTEYWSEYDVDKEGNIIERPGNSAVIVEPVRSRRPGERSATNYEEALRKSTAIKSNLRFDALEKKLISKKDRVLIGKKMLEAVAFLHKNMIIHRDIKPENILLDEDFNPVLADFTLSKIFNGPSRKGTHTGKVATATYRAPEIVAKKSYGFPADAWSLGVVLYELFSGEQLKIDKDKEALEFISNQLPKFKKNKMCDMVKGLLNPDPKLRRTPEQALESGVFENISIPDICWSGLIKCNISKNIKEMCKNFESEKTITKWAAQTYLEQTGCSAHSAVELACKMYETELYSIENEEYAEEEMLILKKMNYNLFV